MEEGMFGKHRPFLLASSDGCSVFQFRTDEGDGTMTCYEVIPGAMLSFNDFHMPYFQSEYVPGKKIFAIDHCREGRMEYLAAENAYAYIKAGDMKLDGRKKHTGRFVFPSSHYHGVTVAFDVEAAHRALKEEMKDFTVDLPALYEKFCKGDYPRVIQEAEKQPYYYKTQVEKVKAIGALLGQELSENYTQEELSQKFDLPLTTMKNCFKSVFGKTIGAFQSECRMNYAAELLRSNKELGVLEIAGRVGYDSGGKFAIAFRKVMGMSPTEYRNAIR